MKKIMVAVDKCLSCHSCELACAVAHSQSGELFQALLGGEKPVSRVRVEKSSSGAIAMQCRHCEDAPCLLACMTGAIQRAEDGSIQVRQDRCVSCWMCVMSCPFGVMLTGTGGKALKCDLCSKKEQPACVVACPSGALQYAEGEDFAAKARQDYIGRLFQYGRVRNGQIYDR